jgi:hypothetical protein
MLLHVLSAPHRDDAFGSAVPPFPRMERDSSSPVFQRADRFDPTPASQAQYEIIVLIIRTRPSAERTIEPAFRLLYVHDSNLCFP